MKKVVDEGSKEGADEAQVVKEKKYGENPSRFLPVSLGILMNLVCVLVLQELQEYAW